MPTRPLSIPKTEDKDLHPRATSMSLSILSLVPDPHQLLAVPSAKAGRTNEAQAERGKCPTNRLAPATSLSGVNCGIFRPDTRGHDAILTWLSEVAGKWWHLGIQTKHTKKSFVLFKLGPSDSFSSFVGLRILESVLFTRQRARRA